jgi:predicted nucleotidyltransferase component of viral defense system
MAIRWHEEAPDDLREAIRFTAAETGFLPRLIEKDYFCSVALEALATTETALVFKGGTCLAKVHSGFYRLSEDLDFAVSLAVDATRGARSNAAAPFKNLIAALGAEGSAFDVLDPLRGSNASRQYNGTLRYRSLLERREETIRIEISLREPVLDPPAHLSARTAVLHWRDRTPLVEDLSLRCLSYREAMAEKLRAALSRREPAVRDFFDLDHAVESGRLDAEDGAARAGSSEACRVGGGR